MSTYIQEINVETYRGLNDLKITNLGSINILLGNNNSGKTSLLEAIQIISDPSEYNLIRVARQREKYKFNLLGSNTLDALLYLFKVSSSNKIKPNYHIKITAMIENTTLDFSIDGEIVEQLLDVNKIKNQIRIPLSSDATNDYAEAESFFQEVKTFIGNLSVQYSNLLETAPHNTPLSINKYTRPIGLKKTPVLLKLQNIQTIDHIVENAFSEIIKNKSVKDKAIALLKYFDETISDLRYIDNDNRFIPVIENNLSEYLPLSLYGDGMKKAITILNAIVKAENGVVLVDEFETAIHTSVMEKVFNFIFMASEQLNVQLFLTTHSIEAVDKVLNCQQKYIDNLRFITLKKDLSTEKTFVRNLSGKEVKEDRASFNFEVRE